MPVRIALMGRAQRPGSEGKALLHKGIGRQTRTAAMHREQNDECTLGILHDSVAPACDLGSPGLPAIILSPSSHGTQIMSRRCQPAVSALVQYRPAFFATRPGRV